VAATHRQVLFASLVRLHLMMLVMLMPFHTGEQYAAFEACGKCKVQQGGASTFTSGLQFIQQG
jgi:hypothetical protein